MSNADPDDGEATCRPVDSFCCGCSLDSGVQIILTLNMLISFFYMFITVSNIVLVSGSYKDGPGYYLPTIGGDIDLFTQVTNCFLAICSVPFIISGISGIKYQIELHLRLYLYWMMFTFALDMVFWAVLLVKTNCVNMPPALAKSGGSFACGATRIMSFAFMCALMTIVGYCIFVVWSKCQALETWGCTEAMDVLGGAKKRKEIRRWHHDPSGLFGTGASKMVANPTVYGSIATPAFCGSVSLWNGRKHEMNYPPKRES